jgi:hypothetical protein
MPTLTLGREREAPGPQRRVPRYLGPEPGGVKGSAYGVRHVPRLLVLATPGRLTARACGLDERDVASGTTWCDDFAPELMIELI